MTETANSTGANLTTATFIVPSDVEGMRGLFDVEVLSLTCLRLIPRNNLAKSILSVLMHGTPAAVSLQMRGMTRPAHLNHRDGHTQRVATVECMELVFAERAPQLSKGADDLMQYTAMRLKPEEYDAARKVVDEMRNPKPAPKRARKR